MNTAAIQTYKPSEDQILENVIIKGDISGLNPKERSKYYLQVCESLGLDPLTQPFAMINLKGKFLLYATKNCTDQLTRKYKLTRKTLEYPKEIEVAGQCVIRCVVEVSSPDNRAEQSTGAVPINKGATAEEVCNLLMKCETKAKRRAVLSIVGLGCLDESELDTLPQEARDSIQQIAPVDESQDVVSGEFEAPQARGDLPAPPDRLNLEQSKSEPVTVQTQSAVTTQEPAKEAPKKTRITREYVDQLLEKAKVYLQAEAEASDAEALNSLFSTLVYEAPKALAKAHLQVAITAQRYLDALDKAENDGDVISVLARFNPQFEAWSDIWDLYRKSLKRNAIQAYSAAAKCSEKEAVERIPAELEKHGSDPVSKNATPEQAKAQWMAHLSTKMRLDEVQGSFTKYCLTWSQDIFPALQDITEQRIVAMGQEPGAATSFVYSAYQKALHNQKKAQKAGA